MMSDPKLKITIGPNPNQDFKITLGDEDVTEKFHVKQLDLRVSGDSGPTTVELLCYVDEVEIMPDTAQIRVIDERRTGRLRQGEQGQWYLVPESEIEEFDCRDRVLREMDGTEENFDDLCQSFTDIFEEYRLSGGPEIVEAVIR